MKKERMLSDVAKRSFQRFMNRRKGRVTMLELYVQGAYFGANFVIKTMRKDASK